MTVDATVGRENCREISIDPSLTMSNAEGLARP
jgi:hypothetical protein